MKGIWGVIEFLEDDEEFEDDVITDHADDPMSEIFELYLLNPRDHFIEPERLETFTYGELKFLEGRCCFGSRVKRRHRCMSILTPTPTEKWAE